MVISLALVGVLLLQVALIHTNTELYSWLDVYLEKRKAQWFMPPPEGTRVTDVSAEICPRVSPEILGEVMAKHPFFMTTNISSKAMGLAAGTRSWRVTRWIGLFQSQSLSIYLALDGHCMARYRHGT